MHLLRTLPTSNLASTTLSENGSIQSFSLMNIMDGLQGNSYTTSFLEQAYQLFNVLQKIHTFSIQREWPEKIMIPDMKEMVNEFEPDLIFADGDNQLPGTDSVYWGSTEFLAWLYNDSPVKENVIVNDR